jgi:hypothetical protein
MNGYSAFHCFKSWSRSPPFRVEDGDFRAFIKYTAPLQTSCLNLI